MKTLLKAILDKHQILIRDAQLNVKDVVIEECDDAKCTKSKMIYRIMSGSKTLGKGPTKDSAWENAALEILGI